MQEIFPCGQITERHVLRHSGMADSKDPEGSTGAAMQHVSTGAATIQGDALPPLGGSDLSGHKRKAAEPESRESTEGRRGAAVVPVIEGGEQGCIVTALGSMGPAQFSEDVVMASGDADKAISKSRVNRTHKNSDGAAAAAAEAEVEAEGSSRTAANLPSSTAAGNWGASNDPFLCALNRMIGPRGGVHNEKHLHALESMFEVSGR